MCMRAHVGGVGFGGGGRGGGVYIYDSVHSGALTPCCCMQKCWFLSMLILPHALGLPQRVVCKLLEAFCDLSSPVNLLSGRTTARMARFAVTNLDVGDWHTGKQTVYLILLLAYLCETFLVLKSVCS